MRIALMMASQWEDSELELLEKGLEAEIVPSPWVAGADVTVAVSRTPGGSRWFAWSRSFSQKEEGWKVWSDTLEGLVEKIKREVE